MCASVCQTFRSFTFFWWVSIGVENVSVELTEMTASNVTSNTTCEDTLKGIVQVFLKREVFIQGQFIAYSRCRCGWQILKTAGVRVKDAKK